MKAGDSLPIRKTRGGYHSPLPSGRELYAIGGRAGPVAAEHDPRAKRQAPARLKIGGPYLWRQPERRNTLSLDFLRNSARATGCQTSHR
ncbi:MAG TPA: hypothetical protein VEI07_23395, partial [Planctomycetaceae bacterium]|nr:hypothetical protein [Planctomycetaceae bacterium]